MLIGAILVVWLYLNTPETTETRTTGKDSITVLQTDTLVTDVDGKEIIEEPEKTNLIGQPQDSVEQFGIFAEHITDAGRIITIETNLAIYELSTLGANLHKVYLKKYNKIGKLDDF